MNRIEGARRAIARTGLGMLATANALRSPGTDPAVITGLGAVV